MKIYNPTDIGDRNKLMILRLIKVYDGISRQEISKRMHLSAPAVSNNVAALIENGIVYENGCDDTSLGRKPRQLSYKGDLYYVISVELMPKKVRAGIADQYGIGDDNGDFSYNFFHNGICRLITLFSSQNKI